MRLGRAPLFWVLGVGVCFGVLGALAQGAITADYSFLTGQLIVNGDNADNDITIGSTTGGEIVVNGGTVPISVTFGVDPTVSNTIVIQVNAFGGNDEVILNEVNGTLPRAVMEGGKGNDTLIGGSGGDSLSGGDGNDLLRGGDGVDDLDGDEGNDTLLGDRGNDNVDGGAGSDLLIVNNGDGSDFVEGGSENDTLQVNGADGAGDDFRANPNGNRVRFQRNNLGLFALDIGTVENLDVNGQGGNDVIIGSVGLNGLISLDFDGGEGNDLLIGGDGVDTLRGGAGNDTIVGGKGNDVQLGEDGSDLFVWNNGDGSDLLEGGDDRDTAQVNGADGAGDDFSVDPNGARVRFQRNNLGLFALDIGTTEDLDVNGQGGNDIVAGRVGLLGLIELDLDGGEGNDLLIGGDGVDTLRGGAGNDTLLGGRGNDVVLGQGGFDLLIWNDGDGSDFLEGGADGDTVQVNGSDAEGDDFSIDPNGDRVRFRRINLVPFTLDIGTTEDLDVNGQGGSDAMAGTVGLRNLIGLDLDGGQGNDLLIGGDGVDTMRGGAGNDTLIGNKGNDVKLGEDGDDLLVWNNGDGSDFMEGGNDSDTVQVNGADGAGDDFSVDPNGDRVRFQRNNLGLFALDIGTTEDLDVNGQGGNDVIAGSVGLRNLIELDLDGGQDNDLLIGGDGVDTLRGGAGNDTIVGGKGNDVQLGEEGNDLFVWNNGDGSDLMEGGGDSDTVQVNGADGAGDDFSVDPNGARVRFQRNNLGLFALDIGTTEDLDVNGQGGNDIIAGSAGLSGLIELDFDGGEDHDLLIGGDGVDTLRGGAGNDTLIGAGGNDVKLGEDGQDLFVWNNGDGSDLMEGGSGRDTVQVNGSDSVGDDISITPNGNRLRVIGRFPTSFSLDIGTTEDLDVNGQGGSDCLHGSVGLAGLGVSLDLDGGAGNDMLSGGDGADTLRGGAGDDILRGNLGNDVLLGEDDADSLWGGAGNDVMFGQDGNDSLAGGTGSDQLDGGNDDDVLNGGEGTDTLNGGGGSNRNLSLDASDITLQGGNGNGVLDPDECVDVFVTISEAAFGGHLIIQSAVLDALTPGIAVTQAAATFSPRSGGTNVEPFRVRSFASMPCAGPIDFRLTLGTDRGTFVLLFSMPAGCSPGGGVCEPGLVVPGELLDANPRLNEVLGGDAQPGLAGATNRCSTPTAVPAPGARFTVHQFTNFGAATPVTVVLDPRCGGGSSLLAAAAYLNGFDPGDVCLNYLGEVACEETQRGPWSFAFTIPAGATFEVVVFETVPDGGCAEYALEVFGLPMPPLEFRIDYVRGPDAIRLSWVAAGDVFEPAVSIDLGEADDFTPVEAARTVTAGNYSVMLPRVPDAAYFRMERRTE